MEHQSVNEWYLQHRAEIAQKTNELQKLNSINRKLANLYPDNINYTYELAIIEYKEKNYEAAFRSLNRIEEITGVDENISFLRNNINYDLKKYDAIQAELLKLKVFFPDSVKYMDMLAEFYVNFNMPEKALNLYYNILNIDSLNINALYGLAFINGKIKNYSKGYPYLKRILDSDEISTDRKEKCAAFYLEYNTKVLTDEQISYIYLSILSARDFNIDIINDYLNYLYKFKQLTETERIAKISIKKRPENYWAWDYLFNILLSQSRYDELNAFAIKAVEYFPAQANVYFYAGYSFFVERKFNEAITYLESGKEYIVDNKILNQQFILYLAESYHSIGKHKKSDEYFEEYLSVDSTNAYLLNNYAYYLTKRNVDLNKAEQLSLKSIEIEPFNSTFLDTYSWILYSKSDFQKALNFIQRAYRYGGNKNPVIVEHYGDILNKLSNNSEALEKWKEALSFNPQNLQLIEKIKSLNK